MMSCLQDALFLDRTGGGYFNNTGEDSSVLLRVKEDHDGADPSGNSVSAINLIRLASMVAGSKAEHYKRNAEHLLVCKPLSPFLLKAVLVYVLTPNNGGMGLLEGICYLTTGPFAID